MVEKGKKLSLLRFAGRDQIYHLLRVIIINRRGF